MLYTSPWSRFELTASVVIATDWICSCKSIYHTITVTTAPCENDIQVTTQNGKLKSETSVEIKLKHYTKLWCEGHMKNKMLYYRVIEWIFIYIRAVTILLYNRNLEMILASLWNVAKVMCWSDRGISISLITWAIILFADSTNADI